jgi:hypothetical protein
MGRIDHNLIKLGKLTYTHDDRNLKLADYLIVRELPPLPDTYDWFQRVSRFGPMGNLNAGDCVVAGAGHMVQTWTANQGREVIISDQDIIRLYSQLTGYDPDTGANDDGLNILAFLKFWRNTGVAGHKIGAFVQVNPHDHSQLAYANYLFGGVYCGLDLPLTARNQQIWDSTDPALTGNAEPGSWGGHCVNLGIHDPLGYVFSTWGEEQYATRSFVDAYCDEAFAIISQDFFDGTGKAPNGFDLDSLAKDLQAITG